MAEVARGAPRWVTIPVEEYESMRRTIDTLGQKELMRQLRESEAAKKTGRVRPFEDVARELGI